MSVDFCLLKEQGQDVMGGIFGCKLVYWVMILSVVLIVGLVLVQVVFDQFMMMVFVVLDVFDQVVLFVDDGDIVVIGLCIVCKNFDSGQFIIIVDSKLIEQCGYFNIVDVLQELLLFGVFGSSCVGGQVGVFGFGQLFVNFFGLGDQCILMIVNG